MAATARSGRGQAGDAPDKACYVYGVVGGDVEVMPEAKGIGDPPAPVTLIRRGDVAALVSEVDVDRPIGRPDDLLAHERILDATAVAAPVLPMRFGAVVTTPEAVAEELLDANHDQLAGALRELEGRAEYLIRGRYVEEALLTEVMSESPEAAKLRDRLRGRPEAETRDLRIRLGETINQLVEAKREADTRAIVDAVAPISEHSAVRPPSHEEDAAHVAVLIRIAKEAELERRLSGLARDWDGRVALRLLGPLAPYDFVVTPEPEAAA